MTHAAQDEDPFEPAHRKGLPPRQFWSVNRERSCTAPRCSEKRDSVSSYCKAHYRRWCSHGHLTKPNVAPEDIHVAKVRVRRILERSIEAGHPQALASIQRIHRLLHAPDNEIQREQRHEYLRRLSAAGADPKEIIVETAAVLLCLFRRDPDGYEDPDYLAVQITRRLVKLAPRKYANGGEGRSMKRSKAMAGAVLDAIAPLCTLLVATAERDRKLRQAKRRPANHQHKEHSTT